MKTPLKSILATMLLVAGACTSGPLVAAEAYSLRLQDSMINSTLEQLVKAHALSFAKHKGGYGVSEYVIDITDASIAFGGDTVSVNLAIEAKAKINLVLVRFDLTGRGRIRLLGNLEQKSVDDGYQVLFEPTTLWIDINNFPGFAERLINDSQVFLRYLPTITLNSLETELLPTIPANQLVSPIPVLRVEDGQITLGLQPRRALPNLQIAALKYGIVDGDSVVTVTIQNLSNDACGSNECVAKHDFSVRLFDGNPALGGDGEIDVPLSYGVNEIAPLRRIAMLAAGATTDVQFSDINVPSGGEHRLFAVVDMLNRVREFDETDNVASENVEFPGPLPQLLVINERHDPLVGAGEILRYDGRAGALIDAFVPSCVTVDPVHVDCQASPHAAEQPLDMAYGPRDWLYVADSPISAFGGSSSSGVAIKRYNGRTGAREQYEPFAPETYSPFVYYGDGGLEQIGGLAFGPDRHLYLSNWLPSMGGQVLKYDGRTGAFAEEFVAVGLEAPTHLTFGPQGDLYVVETRNSSIVQVAGPLSTSYPPGSVIGTFVAAGAGDLVAPSDIVFGDDGLLYVADKESDRVVRFQGPLGIEPGAYVDTFVTADEGRLTSPDSLAFGPDGDLFVSSGSSVLRYDKDSGSFIGGFAFVRSPRKLVFSTTPEPQTDLGDFNGDGCVDRLDLVQDMLPAVRARSSERKFDLNGDGVVNIADARKLTLLFQEPFGNACPP